MACTHAGQLYIVNSLFCKQSSLSMVCAASGAAYCVASVGLRGLLTVHAACVWWFHEVCHGLQSLAAGEREVHHLCQQRACSKACPCLPRGRCPASTRSKGMLPAPRPAVPMLPARKAGAPAQQFPSAGPPWRAAAARAKAADPPSRCSRPAPPRGPPAQHMLLWWGRKPWAAPNQVSADKVRVTSGQHSMINVDARSAPKGPGPQGMPVMASPGSAMGQRAAHPGPGQASGQHVTALRFCPCLR